MAAVVTAARYRELTGDADSSDADVDGWIADATARLEDALDRKLEEAERTEQMRPTRDGRLWPHAIPIISADGYTIDDLALIGTWGTTTWSLVGPRSNAVTVTYTGGWVERTANPDAANRLPLCIEEDLAIAAYLIGHPAPLAAQTAVPVGAQSVSLGDASISFGANGAPIPRPTRIQWTSRTLGYRYLRIGGEPAC